MAALSTKLSRNGRSLARYREVFFAHNGPGPYRCFDCGGEVEFDEVLIHHDDDDRANDDVENLAAAHPSCHKRHHNLKPERLKAFKLAAGTKTLGHREAISAAVKASPKAQAQRADLAAALAATPAGVLGERGRRAAAARWGNRG